VEWFGVGQPEGGFAFGLECRLNSTAVGRWRAYYGSVLSSSVSKRSSTMVMSAKMLG
jgi:hypothetical protein